MFDIEKREHEIMEYWAKDDPTNKLREKNKGKKKFFFLEGPPYISGPLAAHHAWVESVKDTILRYRRYKGYDVHDRAGFDVHGLPTESTIEKKLGIASKDEIESKIGVEKFIQECKNFAMQNIENSIKTLKKYGSTLNFEERYLPYTNEYMEKAWKILAEIDKKGLLYDSLSVLAYCPHCQTVFSSQSANIEYKMSDSPSIHVAFKADSGNIGDNVYFVIWTTTPWTIPANIAIAVNPSAIYVEVKAEDKNYIVAKDRLTDFSNAINKSCIVLKEFYGSELEGMHYIHPLENEVPIQKEFRKYHKIIASGELANTSEGTGLVHVAPGHGISDYELGKKYDLPIFSPLGPHAEYTKDAGVYEGLVAPAEANKKVLEDLKKYGALLASGHITHSYPHCERCGSELVFRATKQWFINIQKIKDKTIEANESISWYPEIAKKWQEDSLRSSPDWCISRQRYFGIPIPIWKCNSCGNITVIGSLKELKEKAVDPKLVENLEDMHKPYVDRIKIKCSKCGGEMSRIPDVFDVWYDSGIAHTASLNDEEFKRLFPADWISESSDQIRGWFSTLIRTSVALYGRSPFTHVSIGGMLVDEYGNEMHRHLGNAIDAESLLKLTSVDGFRLWCTSKPRWADLKLRLKELKESNNNIITLYNIAELVKGLSKVTGISTKEAFEIEWERLHDEDLWIISRINNVALLADSYFESYKLDNAVSELRSFMLNDLSRFYIKLAKKRAKEDSNEAKTVLKVLLYVLKKLLPMLSCAIPYSTEYIYRELFSNGESIFLSEWPNGDKEKVNTQLENEFKIAIEAVSALLNSREKNGIPLRQPLENATLEMQNDAYEAAQKLASIIEAYTGIKNVEVKLARLAKEVVPVFAKIGPKFKADANMVAEALRNTDADELQNEVERKGSYALHTEKGIYEIEPECFVIKEKKEKEGAVQFKYGLAYVDTKISKKLLDEYIEKEVTRTIQLMRKKEKKDILEEVTVHISAANEIEEVIKAQEEKIKRATKAKEIIFGNNNGIGINVNGFEVKIEIE